MNAYLRARWTLARMGRSGYRKFRNQLRSITPFRLRYPLANLLGGKGNEERNLSAFDFPSPRNYDIICFPIIDWNLRFQRPQQLLTQFARHGHRVFYLHTTFHQADRFPLVKNIIQNVYRVRLPGPRDADALYKGDLNQESSDLWAGALDHLRQHARIEESVCLVELPNWSRLALSLRKWRWKIVYDCMDEHGGFSNPRADVSANEGDLVAGSDLVVATSRLLEEKVKGQARRVLYLPNAADFEHFSHRGPLRPLKGLTGAVIGYYGAISEWFDIEMVETAAKLRNNWQFILIGDTKGANVNPLRRLRNVHLPGEMPYRDLPAYLHHFDVASIPFLITPLTAATNPVKFYEYLSAGKPIVSSPLPELEPYKNLFYTARSGQEFVSQIESAMNEQSAEKIKARIEVARLNTWEHRFRQLTDVIKTI